MKRFLVQNVWALFGVALAVLSIIGAKKWVDYDEKSRQIKPDPEKVAIGTNFADAGRETEKQPVQRGKPKFGDLDPLMAALEEAGIKARYEGDLMSRGDMAGGHFGELVRVLLLRVQTPLTTTQTKAACLVAEKYFASPGVWQLSWDYGALGIIADEGDQKTRIVPLRYTLPADRPDSQLVQGTLFSAMRGSGLSSEEAEQPGEVLIQSIKHGNDADAFALIDAKPAVIRYRTKHKVTPLHFAASAGRLSIARYLVERGADIDATDSAGKTPLNWAALEEKQVVADYLIQMKATLDIYSAAALGEIENVFSPIESIKKFILGGGDVNKIDSDGNTMLHFAAEHGRARTVALLIEMGANLDAENLYGYTALHEACRKSEADVAKMLIDSGANIEKKTTNVRPFQSYESPLFIAVNNFRAAAAQENAMDPKSARNRLLEIIDYLIKKGADVNTVNSHRATPLDCAESPELVEYLTRHGARHGTSHTGTATKTHPIAQLPFPQASYEDDAENTGKSRSLDAARFDNMIKEFGNIQTRVKQTQLGVFNNAIEITLFRLKDSRKTLNSFAHLMPIEALSEADSSAMDLNSRGSNKDIPYWKKLEKALLEIGYIESAKSGAIWLIAKRFPDQLPKDAHLIMGGLYQGFFTLANGDKFVAGIQFYEQVINGQAKLEDLPHIDLYWSERISNADKLATAGKTSEALKAYAEFLQDPMAPSENIGLAYYNSGNIYLSELLLHPPDGELLAPGGKLELAKKSFTEAIHYIPDLYLAYQQRAVVLHIGLQYDAALHDCNKALEIQLSLPLQTSRSGQSTTVQNRKWAFRDPKSIEIIGKLKKLIEEGN